MMARCSDSECNNIHCNGDNKNCPASSSYDRIADLERQLTAETERRERAEADAERLRNACQPFAGIVKETSGRIPTERLSFADWHALTKAVNGDTAKPEAPRVEPTSCGYCDYDEAEGFLIKQCRKCAAIDSARLQEQPK